MSIKINYNGKPTIIENYVRVWLHSGIDKIMMNYHDYVEATLYSFCKIIVIHRDFVNFIVKPTKHEWTQQDLSKSLLFKYMQLKSLEKNDETGLGQNPV